MKIPSLVRLPSHKRFEFTPRYYDEVKERIAERERMYAKGKENMETDESYRQRISDAFRRTEREEKQSIGIKLAVVIMLVTFLISFLGMGNIFG